MSKHVNEEQVIFEVKIPVPVPEKLLYDAFISSGVSADSLTNYLSGVVCDALGAICDL